MTSATDGRSLGKYRLLAKIGEGGMADVYLAVAHGPGGFNKLVVIKQLHAELAEDPEHLAMFLDEARLAARLSHPNVAQTNEIGSDGGRHFIAMEFLDGQPLNRLRRRFAASGGLPLVVELRVLADVLAALQYAHELADYDGTPLRVVHRDVSPHNVFVTYDGRVLLLDFGIAKTADSSFKTKTGALKGKIAYMPPEQARGDPLDRRADIYAVGVLLWEAATGTRMWKGVEDVVILQRVLAGEIPGPRAVRPDIDERLDQICRAALAPDVEARFATAAKMKEAIDEVAESLGPRLGREELGALVARTFESERKQMTVVIEEQLRASRAGRDDADVARLPRLAMTAESPSSRSLEAAQSPTRVTPTHASSANVSRSVSKTLSEARPPARSAGVWAPVLASAGIAAFVAVVMTLWLKGSPREAAAPPAASAAPPALAESVAVAPPLPVEIGLRVVATPAGAKLFLDGAPLDGCPYEGKRAKDGAKHELRVEAPGYDPKIEEVVFDRDVAIALALDRTPPRPRGGKTVQTSAPADAPAGPPKKAKQDIDPDNPYAK